MGGIALREAKVSFESRGPSSHHREPYRHSSERKARLGIHMEHTPTGRTQLLWKAILSYERAYLNKVNKTKQNKEEGCWLKMKIAIYKL